MQRENKIQNIQVAQSSRESQYACPALLEKGIVEQDGGPSRRSCSTTERGVVKSDLHNPHDKLPSFNKTIVSLCVKANLTYTGKVRRVNGRDLGRVGSWKRHDLDESRQHSENSERMPFHYSGKSDRQSGREAQA